MADDYDYNNDDDIAGEDGEERYCKVYDKNDFFTVVVQIMLAAFALLSLYYKRMHEVPRRTFGTWFLDVSKQAIGACYAHVLNMVIAAVISQNIRGETELKDQCAWYGLSYLIDTTLGLVLAIIFLNMLDKIANERDWVHLKHSGVYTGEDALLTWLVQVTAWMINLTLVKIIIYAFMWLFSDILAYVGGLLFAPFESNIRFELLFVMIFFPGFLNVVYFWIADSYLKAKKEHAGAHEYDPHVMEIEIDDSAKGNYSKKEGLLSDQEKQPEQQQVGSQKSRPWTTLESVPRKTAGPKTTGLDDDEPAAGGEKPDSADV